MNTHETLPDLTPDLAVGETDWMHESNQALQDFAYTVSHDLQEPLRAVLSYVDLLSNRYRENLDDNAGEFMDFAIDGARRMQAMIEDLLRYSRIATHGSAFTSVRLKKIVDESIGRLDTQIKAADACITVPDELPTINGDSRQLAQLMEELVDNAIKFCGDARPEIEIACEESETSQLVSVTDNGIGLEPRFAERAFDIFQRLNPRANYKGNGVGLALAERIVERHGGRIWVESTLGQGARFIVAFRKQ